MPTLPRHGGRFSPGDTQTASDAQGHGKEGKSAAYPRQELQSAYLGLLQLFIASCRS
jgi:hypothetical protein